MAKTNITLPDGTKVTIEGSADEVATLLNKFSNHDAATATTATTRKKKKKKTRGSSGGTSVKRKGPQVLIGELNAENYFKSKRTIGDIQKKLEEKGHIYALESLSTPLLRLTRNRTLRRIKEKSGWVYVS